MARTENRTAIEDYLKVIFGLGEWQDETVSNAAVAARLGVSTSSVSEMARKLADAGLVAHKRYGGMRLTDEGLGQALRMVRRHRLVETFLVTSLGYAWDEVHDDAEVLEHAVSSLMVERMDEQLGRPWRDPHGDPIPTAEGVLHQPTTEPLAASPIGERRFVARIDDDDPALLRWLADAGIDVDAEVVVRERRPFGGATLVDVTPRGGVDGPSRSSELGDQAVAALLVSIDPASPNPLNANGCHYADCRHISAARVSEKNR
ncbi:manganese-binding transcriptional regulator MntR [Terrabacter aerolatus]|uniref:Manganese transport regulator n=1 Tax=Terrabacter aerolatus TaxID=422442 RepID=A0A512D3A5_9MICO|nr:metal-dependent transcriptional regulator [Terrabacter aerolatus]GEO30933.1 putative iron dependent transcriptional repressor FeoA [Terrabacter aerolatus]